MARVERLELALEAATDAALRLVPLAAALLLIALCAWLLARLVRRVVPAVSARIGLDERARRLGVDALLRRLQLEMSASQALERLLRWGIGLGALGLMLESLGFEALSGALGRMLAFSPQALLGLAIALGSVALADRAERVFLKVAGRGEWAGASVVGRLLHYGIVVLGISVAAEQLGLEVSLLRGLLVAALGGAVLGVFGLLASGLEPMIGRLMTRYYLRRTLEPGDRLTIAGCAGELVQFGATGLVLRGEAGTHLIPYDVALRGPLGRLRAAPEPEEQA